MKNNTLRVLEFVAAAMFVAMGFLINETFYLKVSAVALLIGLGIELIMSSVWQNRYAKCVDCETEGNNG